LAEFLACLSTPAKIFASMTSLPLLWFFCITSIPWFFKSRRDKNILMVFFSHTANENLIDLFDVDFVRVQGTLAALASHL
jgi:hypothetical protein